MRVVYMGTPDFAVGALEALLSSEHEVAAVVTQPDKPRGRGKAMCPSPVKEVAVRAGIPVLQPKRIREPEAAEQIRMFRPDILVVVAFGQIIPREVLDIAPYGCVNVHGSLLPKYRGAAPIQWAVINGERESGVTTMQMDEGLDTGDILLKKVIPLDEKETGGSLFEKLAAAGAKLLLETLEGLENGAITPMKQGASPTPYAEMLKKETGAIDWKKSAEKIERLIRGLNPWPSAYTKLNGKTLKLWQADAIKVNSQTAAGTVLKAEKDQLWIQTGDGVLAVRELQLEGKKRMDAGAFLRGHSVEKGMIL